MCRPARQERRTTQRCVHMETQAPSQRVCAGCGEAMRAECWHKCSKCKAWVHTHITCSRWKGTPGFSKGESWIPAGTRGTLGSRSCRRVPLESDVNFQLKQSNRGFSFSASHLIWILASPPGIAGFRAGRPAARDPAEVVTSVLLGTHEHTRKTNCMEKSLLSLNCMTVHDLCRPSPAL